MERIHNVVNWLYYASMAYNKTLWERIFGRGRTRRMILWTCLIAAKQLASYIIGEDKSSTLLVCWSTQLIQYVPIHNNNPVISWQCLKICTSSTYDISGYSPESKFCLSSTDTDALRKIDWQMRFYTHHIVQCIPVTHRRKFSRTAWPETHRPRIIMRLRD